MVATQWIVVLSFPVTSPHHITTSFWSAPCALTSSGPPSRGLVGRSPVEDQAAIFRDRSLLPIPFLPSPQREGGLKMLGYINQETQWPGDSLERAHRTTRGICERSDAVRIHDYGFGSAVKRVQLRAVKNVKRRGCVRREEGKEWCSHAVRGFIEERASSNIPREPALLKPVPSYI